MNHNNFHMIAKLIHTHICLCSVEVIMGILMENKRCGAVKAGEEDSDGYN